MLLYKYRAFSGSSREFTLDVIRKQQLYFSTPDRFNDPFEFQPHISMDCTNAEFTKYIDGLYSRRFPSMNRQQRREAVAALVRDKSRNHRSPEAAKVMSETMAQITQKCGVLCLSEDPQNVLMWSHYADNHAGVCFGFEASPSNPFFGRAQQVLYSQSYPVVNIILDHSQSYHEKSVLTKADFWAYEKEWRIIEHEKGAGVYAFAASHLEEIIFGLNAQPTDKRAVKEALANLGLHPQIRQAVKHATEFRIELVNDDA